VNGVSATFTSEFDQIKSLAKLFMPVVDLADLVAEFVVEQSPDDKSYVSIAIDETMVTEIDTWNFELLQFLSTYWPLTPATSPPLLKVATASEHLLPWQVAGVEALVAQRMTLSHIDPMDELHQAGPLWFNREGHVTRDPASVLRSPPRTLIINGSLLTEAPGAGTTRTILETLQVMRNCALGPSPPGRVAVRAMAIVVPEHSFSFWTKEAATVLPSHWVVHCVHDTTTLRGLAGKVQTADLVIFSEELLTSNKRICCTLFDSCMHTKKLVRGHSWNDDLQMFRTTFWHTVVIVEADTYVSNNKLVSNTCTLTRKAITIKSLLCGNFTILQSDKPEDLVNLATLDTYAYLMSASHYPLPWSLHDVVRRTTTHLKLLEHLPISDESKAKMRVLLVQHRVVTTGTKVTGGQTREVLLTYQDSQLFKDDFKYADRQSITVFGSLELTDVPFVTQCRDMEDEWLGPLPKSRLDDDEAMGTKLGAFCCSEDDPLVARLNAKQVPACFAPVEAATVRVLLSVLEDEKAKVLICMCSDWIMGNTRKFLKQFHRINLVHIAHDEPVQRRNRKRKLLVDSEGPSRTVLFLSDCHVIDGADFTSLTHVIIVGCIYDYEDRFVKRAALRGPLAITRVRGIYH
jgi:hypothetical protein